MPRWLSAHFAGSGRTARGRAGQSASGWAAKCPRPAAPAKPLPSSGRGGGGRVVFLVEVVRAVEGLDEVAVDGALVARGVVGRRARGQTLDRRVDAGAVEERDRVAVA